VTAPEQDTQPGHRPCGRCGTWPEPFYVLEGDNGRGRTVSFGHFASRGDAVARLVPAQLEFHDLYRWKVLRMTPATITETVDEFETPRDGES